MGLLYMNINEEKFGFRLESIHFSTDANSEIYQFCHLASDGKLIWLKNDDQNKTFGMGFLTPPEDSSGAAHIVEHSVLSGSRKYPAKDPFMQMLKTSMNTFLNAMTFSDMTIYPVSSMNEKDFHNLMDVYLDAVLFPRMHEEENIFLQEGWHPEIFDADDPIKYNGVVYNEMRGAYSTPDRVVMQQVTSEFHPDSTYAHESGGYPYDIPDLTFDNFKAFHAKHYRPENALTYLYGDIDIDRTLAQIDKDFFSEFTQGKGQSQLELPSIDIGENTETLYFDADEQMLVDKDSYLSYTLPFSHADNLYELYLLSILSEALVDAEASPLRAALINRDYGQDISSYSGDSYYLDFGIILEHVDASKRDEIVNIIEKTLAQVSEEGLSRDLLESVINRNELQFRQAGGAMRGVMYFIQVMSAWRYDVSPSSALDYSDIFTQLREHLETDYYEEVIKERLMGANSKQVIVHEPQTGIYAKKDEEIIERLAQVKTEMSKAELQQLIDKNIQLRAYQLKEDDDLAKKALPQLEINDVKREIVDIPTEEIVGKHRIFFHPQSAAGIRYVNIAFPMNVLSAEEISFTEDLMTLIGLVDTENYDYSTLDTELTKVTSGVSVSPKVYVVGEGDDDYTAQAILSFAAIGENSSRAFELILEILTKSQFDNQNRVKNILQRVKTSLEDSFENAGHQMAIGYLRSFYAQSSKYVQQFGGLDYYDHLNQLLKDFPTEFDHYLAKLTSIQEKLWHSNEVVVALTADEADRDSLVAETNDFLEALPNKKLSVQEIKFDLVSSNREAIKTNSNVQYVSVGGSLHDAGYTYSGKMVVLASLISKGYLHELIRAQGGAYGAGLSLTINGDVTTYSYRDPNLTKTIETYANMGEVLRQLEMTQEELDQFIIGSISRFHYPIVASNVNDITLQRHFKGRSKQMIEVSLHEALATTVEDLKDYADMLDKAVKQNNLVVFGNKQEIENNAELFDTIRVLKQ